MEELLKLILPDNHREFYYFQNLQGGQIRDLGSKFHVQKLAFEAVQEIRIKHRWEALHQENQAFEDSGQNKVKYNPEVLENGDTLKQLPAKSKYLLF